MSEIETNAAPSSQKGPQVPQKLSSLKSLTIRTPHRYWAFKLLQPSQMISLSNSRGQNRKECQKQSKNGDMAETYHKRVSL